ncbi:hypothetical protein [Sneathiella glossodoripedis]|uniref:hypothetical protein n=1 Tax=Sneathiella glossodoripedis TaxID=418853 RepID=UPI0004700BA5|nr:hypothetical protein [Sneathiella glossodoripedis]
MIKTVINTFRSECNQLALQGFFFLAAHGLQGLQGFFAAHGLQGFFAAHGLHGFFAAQGLQAFFFGLHGLQALATTNSPAFCAACATGTEAIVAAEIAVKLSAVTFRDFLIIGYPTPVVLSY